MHRETVSELTLYISPKGRDSWSGRLPERNADGTDGPLSSMNGVHWVLRQLREGGHVSGKITLCFRGGRYEMSQPIVIDPRDCGPLTLTSFEGEEAVISGGRRITGWEESTIRGRTVWTTVIPEVHAGDWYFRQLFVNGERRDRPCLPKKGEYWMRSVPGLDLSKGMIDQFIYGNNRFYADPEDLGAWSNITDIDVVAYHYWVEERLPVVELDPASGYVACGRRSIFILRDDLEGRYARYRFENVAEALTEPGEWYLDRKSGTLSYIPLPGETIEGCEFTAPKTAVLLALKGSAETPVEHVTVENLVFECTAWAQPPAGSLEGIWDEEANRRDELFGAATQAACNLGGAVMLRYARWCTIRGCTIRNVGHYGIVLGEGCTNDDVSSNVLKDLGAGGIRVNGGTAADPRDTWNGDNTITDNEIVSGGRVFASGVGVILMHTFGNLVAHNHIHDLYYSGVSCGWVWGYGPNVSRDNRIEYNHIHDIGQGLLSDMGGIYTLGVQPGTILRGNVIHDITQRNYGGWCIYLDEGSSHILVEGNLCYRGGTEAFNQHYGRENVVRNNIFAFGGHTVAKLGRLENHNSIGFSHNILLSDGKPVYAPPAARRPGHLGFRSDMNILWDTTGTLTAAVSGPEQMDIDGWRETGNDLASIVCDPGFRDPENGDFSMTGTSAVSRIGMTIFDTAAAGPRRSPGAHR